MATKTMEDGGEGDGGRPAQNRGKKGRRLLKRLLIWVPCVLLALALAAAGALYFAGDKMFAALWPTIDKKLAARGIFIDIGDIDQTRERGLILSDATLYRDAARRTPLATLSDIAVKPRFFDERAGALGAEISLAGSQVQLLTGDTDPSLAGASGRIWVGSSGLAVEGLAARHGGIALEVAGAMAWDSLENVANKKKEAGGAPDRGAGETDPEPLDLGALDLSPVDDVARWLQVGGEGAPLRVGVEFSDSGGAPAAGVSVQGEKLDWRQVAIDKIGLDLRVDLAADARRAELEGLSLAYREGSLSGSASLDLDSGQLEVRELRCDLDLLRLAGEVYPQAADSLATFSYPTPPEWSLAGTVDLSGGDGSDLAGEIALPDGLTIGDGTGATELRILSTQLAFAGDELKAQDLQIGFCGGLLRADASSRPFARPLELSGTITTREALSVAELGRYLGDTPESQDVLSLSGRWGGDLDTLRVEELEIAQGERSLRGEATVDLPAGEVQIASLESDLDLVALLGILAPEVAANLAVVKDLSGPGVEAGGKLVYTDLAASDLVLGIKIDDGCVLDLGREPLAVEALAATFTLRDGEVSTDDLSVRLLGDTVGAELAARPFDEELSMSGTVKTGRGLPLSSLSRFLGEPSDSEDLLGLHAEWSGGLRAIEIAELEVGQGDKSLRAEGHIDLDTMSATIGSLKSDLDLVELTRNLVAAAGEPLATVTSASGPILDVKGSVKFNDLAASDLVAEVTSADGFVLDLGGKPLAFEDLHSTVAMKGGTVSTEDFRVGLLGGQVRADVAVQPFEEGLPFGAGLLIDSLSLQQLASLAGNEEEMPGTASMNFQGTGSTSLAALNGKGIIDVADTEFYAFPLFGKIFGMVNSLNFGFRKGEKGYARGPFAIAGGVLDPAQVELFASSVKIKAPEGKVNLAETRFEDLTINLRPTGLVGLAANTTVGTYDVSVVGPFDDPEIKMADVSGGLAGGALDLAGGSLDVAGDVAGAAIGVIPGVGDKPKEEGATAEATTEEAGGDPEPEKKRFRDRLRVFDRDR